MSENSEKVESFEGLGLSEVVLARLTELGFVTPTPIQARTIPHIIAGRDVMGKAETGTGKTLAFGLPVIEHVDPKRVTPQALILTPTRELAHQVAEALEQVGSAKGLKVARIVGGEPQADQLIALKRGCHIVVGTPGRVMDFGGQRMFSPGWIDLLVLDEADRMLDMGFIDQIKKILAMVPKERQTLLFSATFEPALQKIARKEMRDPVELETSGGLQAAKNIDQSFVRVTRYDKTVLLRKLLDVITDGSIIVFLNTKRETEAVGGELWNRGYKVTTLQGNYDQEVRNRILAEFREGKQRILVATDVAQRGLDITTVCAVINYQVPNNPEDYVHRIGRTGRAGRSGRVLTFVEPREWEDFQRIVKRAGEEIRELDVPPGVRGWSEGEQRRDDGPRRGRGGHGGAGGRPGRGGSGRFSEGGQGRPGRRHAGGGPGGARRPRGGPRR